jgi:hypothetical protein
MTTMMIAVAGPDPGLEITTRGANTTGRITKYRANHARVKPLTIPTLRESIRPTGMMKYDK